MSEEAEALFNEIRTTRSRQPKKKRVWDNYRALSTVQRLERSRYMVAIAARDGVRYIKIYEYYFNKSKQEWLPCKGGITLPLAISFDGGETISTPAEDFIARLQEALEQARDLDLYDEDNMVWITPKPKKAKQQGGTNDKNK